MSVLLINIYLANGRHAIKVCRINEENLGSVNTRPNIPTEVIPTEYLFLFGKGRGGNRVRTKVKALMNAPLLVDHIGSNQ